MHKAITRVAVLIFAMGGLLTVSSCTAEPNHDQTDRIDISTTETPWLLKVDSIRNHDSLKQRLNNHDSVGIIEHNPHVKSHYVHNEVIVKFTVHPSKQEMAEIERHIDGKLVKNLNTICIFSSNSQSASELVRYFKKSSNVEYAEPHYLYLQNQEPSVIVPNDVLYLDHQWNLPMIGAEIGWNFSKGNENVTIAVLDTGVDPDHPDLIDRITEGYNVLQDNDRPDDDNGHGTHVAGIIASQTNNGEGIAGITWYNNIMPIKVMGADGSGTSFDIAKGIMWAADHGADVINLSLGNYQPSDVLKEAIEHAFNQDIVIIAAVGNENTDQPSFPAAYAEVLGISAVGKDKNRAEFSNYGDYVDVAAPGVEIASTYPNQQYAELSGTSMAAPHVTGLAGLMRSLYPELANEEIMTIIKSTAVDLGEPGSDVLYGSGLVDMEKALETTYREKNPFGRVSEWLGRFTP